MAKSPSKDTSTNVEKQPLNQPPQDPSAALHELLSGIEYRLQTIEQRPVSAPAVYIPPNINPRGCECTSSKCCCFEIYVSRVRVTKAQNPILEPGDGTKDPLGLNPLMSEFLELFINVIAGKTSAAITSLAAPLNLSSHVGWFPMNKYISTVSVKNSKSIPTMVEAREVAGPSKLHVLAEQRPEFGTSSLHQLNLQCGCPVVPVLIEVELSGGGITGGSIEVEISAREVCCDTC